MKSRYRRLGPSNLDPKFTEEREIIRRESQREADEHHLHRQELNRIRHKMELYGHNSLTVAERTEVEEHRGYFFPREEG